MSHHLVLAGGGHSHALVLRMWAMHPERRPAGLITLVNRSSTALYSGMVPGLAAGLYRQSDLAINLRTLADQAGVALVVAEITGLDLRKRRLMLLNRPPLTFGRLSLNLGAVTPAAAEIGGGGLAIKPLEPALAALTTHASSGEDDAAGDQEQSGIVLVGSGLAAIELALALRHRWPQRTVTLQARPGRIAPGLRRTLMQSGVTLAESSAADPADEAVVTLRCTGSRGAPWLQTSGLPVDGEGRVRTASTLEVLDHAGVFACGDCAVIADDPRPPSGVWAVRAAAPLARNLEASCRSEQLLPWRPQGRALQLLGDFDRRGRPTAWALWGPLSLGPHRGIWHWKRWIDRRFMARFQGSPMANAPEGNADAMLCRGCAAKLPAEPLEAALDAAGIGSERRPPEDASRLPHAQSEAGHPVLQSLDGFPALVSDPWLNGRLTALHACSDLWACGARVQSAQVVVTVPRTTAVVQQELLSHSLAGIRSVLTSQGADLIGGHTLEARHAAEAPLSQEIQIALSVQGEAEGAIWTKQGIRPGDCLLLSRPLGTGVLFAAAMEGATLPADLDLALQQMNSSQHTLVKRLRTMTGNDPDAIHAATDITGFGLLGHLGEMLGSPRHVQVELLGEAVPALDGAIHLLENGHCSSLAPSNRRAWSLLDPDPDTGSAAVALRLGAIPPHSPRHLALLELLVDPQTCGPLLISVDPDLAARLLAEASTGWRLIGRAKG